MDFCRLGDELKKITMSDEAKYRVIYACRYKMAEEKEKNIMKKFALKRPAVAVLAAALCLCLAIGVGAAVSGGSFVDIKNWNGAITGTEYVQAEGEIGVKAETAKGALIVELEFLEPAKAPYIVLEELAIGSYAIFDKSGELAAEGESAGTAIVDGSAEFELAFDGIPGEEYTLKIETLIGSAKADQPLKIHGNWLIEFVA